MLTSLSFKCRSDLLITHFLMCSPDRSKSSEDLLKAWSVDPTCQYDAPWSARATSYLTFTTAYWLQHHLAVETPTVSLRKFTEHSSLSGRKSHNKENQTTICDKWTLSFCYPTKLMNLFGNILLFFTYCYLSDYIKINCKSIVINFKF